MAHDHEAYIEAHSRYQGYRDAAYDLTWQNLRASVPTDCDLRVMPIDESALAFWQAIQHFGAAGIRGSSGRPYNTQYTCNSFIFPLLVALIASNQTGLTQRRLWAGKGRGLAGAKENHDPIFALKAKAKNDLDAATPCRKPLSR